MKIPTIQGIIDRRVLVNFRVDADVLARVCPAPFRPQTIGGFGIAGICLIRLKNIRPKGLPTFLGISSENAAHRIAVEWNAGTETRSGVYITRRDTSSVLNTLAGGRIFPGVHHRARFDVLESNDKYRVVMDSFDASAHVSVDSRTTDQWPSDSVFANVTECSKFFESGSVGYSPANSANDFDGLELRTDDWQVQPLSIKKVRSSFFNDHDLFPKGSVEFDNALLMRGVPHEWHSCQSICCDVAETPN